MEMQEVSFTSGNRALVGCIFDQGSAGTVRRGVMFVHGQGSSQKGYEQRARKVSRCLDAVCLTFDLSGHGRDAANFNRYSVYDHLQDVLAAYDYLASLDDVNLGRVGVCGASYGGYLASLVTATRAVKRLILRAPSLAKDVKCPTLYNQSPFAKEVPDEFDSIKILGRYTGEVLIVESEKDEVIPKPHIAAYLGTCSRAQHQVIPDATHALTNPRWDEVFVTGINNWFEGL
jgi:pimeloyl-ACP methyl ester carboxylesterase